MTRRHNARQVDASTPSPSEREFQDMVIELAQRTGCLTAHFRAAWTEKGWRTPVQGEGKGFPDNVFMRLEDRRVLFIELKSEQGKASPPQIAWLEGLRHCGQDVHIWRPADWEQIVAVLARR